MHRQSHQSSLSECESHQPVFTSKGDLSDNGIDALAEYLLSLIREPQTEQGGTAAPVRDALPVLPDC